VNAKYALLAVGIVGIVAGCSVETPRATVERATQRPAMDSRRPAVDSQGHAVDSQRVAQPPQLTLVDTADLGDDVISLIAYRLRVRTDKGSHTITDFQVKELPVVGTDGNLYGIAYNRHGDPSSGYRYSPSDRSLSRQPLPQYFDLYASQVALSPDARHIAYISRGGGTSGASGVVRSWPDTIVVAETPAIEASTSEIDHNRVRWLDANRAEFVYTKASEVPAPRDLWIHAVVAVDTRAITVDTLETPAAQRVLKR